MDMLGDANPLFVGIKNAPRLKRTHGGLKKMPAISETIDWARSLLLLHAGELEEDPAEGTRARLIAGQHAVPGVDLARQVVAQLSRMERSYFDARQ